MAKGSTIEIQALLKLLIQPSETSHIGSINWIDRIFDTSKAINNHQVGCDGFDQGRIKED